jgi:phosphopantetheinyl transferase
VLNACGFSLFTGGSRRHFSVFRQDLKQEEAKRGSKKEFREGGKERRMYHNYREMAIPNLFNHRDGPEQASFYVGQFEKPFLHGIAAEFLHPREWEYYATLKHERRISSYLAGRYAAKKAVSMYAKVFDFSAIRIDRGCFHQPVVIGMPNLQVSISHSGNAAAAIAFHEAAPMAIDIEQICGTRTEVLMSQLKPQEIGILRSIPYAFEPMLTLSWSVKEVLAKVLKTGLTVPFGMFELKQLEMHDGYFVSHYVNFVQYVTVSVFFDGYVCSVTYPKGFRPDVNALRDAVSQAVRLY